MYMKDIVNNSTLRMCILPKLEEFLKDKCGLRLLRDELPPLDAPLFKAVRIAKTATIITTQIRDNVKEILMLNSKTARNPMSARSPDTAMSTVLKNAAESTGLATAADFNHIIVAVSRKFDFITSRINV